MRTRNVWKGLVVGGLTGVAAGVVLDLWANGSDQLAQAARSASAHAPDALDRVRQMADRQKERLAESDLPAKAQEAATRLADTTKEAATRAGQAAGEKVSAANEKVSAARQ